MASITTNTPISGSGPIKIGSFDPISRQAKRSNWNESHISYRIFHSPLLRFLFSAGIATMGTIKLGSKLHISLLTMASLQYSLVVISAIAGFGIVSTGLIIYIASRHFRKNSNRYWYELSLTAMIVLNRIFKERWAMYSRIDTHLILSALPLKNMNHHLTFVDKERVGAVVSVVEEFELDYVGIASVPIRKEDWKKLSVEQFHRVVTDLTAISTPIINEAVNFIHENRQRGITTVVHCKAGRGRSAMIVISYLLRHRKELWENCPGKDDVSKAYSYVRNRRHIALTPSQMQQNYIFYHGSPLSTVTATAY